MANKIKGDFDFSAGGTVYRGRFGFNAYCEIQERFGKSAPAVFLELTQTESPVLMRALIGAALREYHEDLTDKDVGRIIDDAGVQVIADAIVRGMQASQPKPKKVEEGEAAATPDPTLTDSGIGKS